MFLLGENGTARDRPCHCGIPVNLRELGAEESPASASCCSGSGGCGGHACPRRNGLEDRRAVVAVIGSVVGLNGLGVFDGPKPQAPPVRQQTGSRRKSRLRRWSLLPQLWSLSRFRPRQ